MVDQRFKNPQGKDAGGLHLWAQDLIGKLRKGFTAADITYDNTTSGLTGDNVQTALDELADLNARLIAVYGQLPGSILAVDDATGDWVVRTPTNADDVLIFDGTDTDFAPVPSSAFEPVTGSPFTISADLTVTGLSGYRDIQYQLDRVTSSSAGTRQLEVSSDGGSTWATVFLLPTATVLVNIIPITSSSSAARSHGGIYWGWGTTLPVKQALDDVPIISASVFDAMRFTNSAGSLNGGTIHILGVPL